MIDVMDSLWLMTAVSLLVMGLTMLVLWRLKPTDYVALAFGAGTILQSARFGLAVITQGGSVPAAFLNDVLQVCVLSLAWIANLYTVGRKPPLQLIATVAALVAVAAVSLRATGHGMLWGGFRHRYHHRRPFLADCVHPSDGQKTG